MDWIKFPIMTTRTEEGQDPIYKMSWLIVRADSIVAIRPWREGDMTVSATVITISTGETFVAEIVPSVVEKYLGLNVFKMPLINLNDEKTDQDPPIG